MKRVEVEWLDSMGQGGWQTAEEAKRKATYDAMRHRTIGYVLADDEDHLLLAMGHSEEGDRDTMLVHDTMQLPRLAILKVRDVR